MSGTHTNRGLSTFDRVGVVIVGVIGMLAGLVFAFDAEIIILTPALIPLLPGIIAAWGVSKVLGEPAASIVCGVVNGAPYTLLLYLWDRLVNSAPAVTVWFLNGRRR